MEFQLKLKNKQISDQDLLDDILKVSTSLNKNCLTIKEYDTYGLYNSTTIIRRFGSWNNCLIRCGLNLSQIFHSEIELLENIAKVWLTKGEQPTRRDMDNKEISSISSGAYLRKYVTWNKALLAFIAYIGEEKKYGKQENKTSIGSANIIKHKTKREPSNRLKVLVLQRDGNCCQLCGEKCIGLHNMNFDHIIPWSKGGETTFDNLRILCEKCNKSLGNCNE